MTDIAPPGEFARLSQLFDDLQLVDLFETYKAFEHHTEHVRDDLMGQGVLIYIGKRAHAHKERFWPAFVRAQHALRAGRVTARAA